MNKADILLNINDSKQLEKLFRENKSDFKQEFNLLYPELKDHPAAGFWKERLNYESPEISWGSRNELALIIFFCFIAGFIARLPQMLNLNEEYFYTRNAAFVLFPVLTSYFAWKRNVPVKKILIALIITLTSVIFINSFPITDKSDSLILSFIHLPVFLWAVLGFIYTGDKFKNYQSRIEFLRYNGELVIMSGLILICGFILTAISFALFNVIGFNIEKIFENYIILFALPAVPIIGTFITQSNPQLINKVSPVIAKIFSPLVLLMLVTYLAAIFVSGKDPYNDREFLMIFNALLIGVMAIILFSIAGSVKNNENKTGNVILFSLSLLTVVVNGIALSAILFRISEWGITANRLAVSGANILMLINLLIITYRLFKTITSKSAISEVEKSIAMFLPVYTIWTIIVIFIFPLLFH